MSDELQIICSFSVLQLRLLCKPAFRIDVDPETSSSFYEESDSSSIPHSPSYSSETEAPRNLSEALAMRDRSQHNAEPPVETLKVPQFRIISPDQGWYRPERSPSPTSPRISPNPKAMKQTGHVTQGPTQDQTTPAHVLITPRPVRFKQSPMPGAKSPTSRSSSIPIRTLTVPSSERRGSDSSSSSYYPYSSRSPSHSPLSHEPPASPRASPRWYPDTPPSTPSKDKDFKFTSSTHRPLGISPTQDTPEPQWQKERWKHWEKLAKQRSDEFHEQETLV